MERLAEDSLFSRDRVPGSRRDRWTLTDYQRLDQAPGAAAERVRRLMDSWYRRLPAHARTEIRQRFTSPKLGAYLGAFWEMYLYEAASRLELKVDLDVGRDHGGRRPDLFVGADEGDHLIEATVALGDAAVRRDQRARADQFYAAIERVRTRDFLLHCELRRLDQVVCLTAAENETVRRVEVDLTGPEKYDRAGIVFADPTPWDNRGMTPSRTEPGGTSVNSSA